MPNLVGYCRVSGESQRDNTSLPGQKAEIESFCRKNNYNLVALCWDVESGESAEKRDGLQDALRLVLGEQADGMVVYKQDRLSRKVSDAEALKEQFKRLGKKLYFVVDPVDWETDDGEMMFQFKSVFAEYERKQIRKRCLEGKRRKDAVGGYTGGRPPFGWRSVKGALEAHPEEQKTIAYMVDLSNRGFSFYAIQYELNAKVADYPPRAARFWNDTTIKSILMNKSLLLGITGRFNGTSVRRISPQCLEQEDPILTESRSCDVTSTKEPFGIWRKRAT